MYDKDIAAYRAYCKTTKLNTTTNCYFNVRMFATQYHDTITMTHKDSFYIATTKQELQQAIACKQQQYYEYRKAIHNSDDSIHSDSSKIFNLDSTIPSIGLVPTMGALHDGHKSLIQASTTHNHITIVSIFVNPTQFAPNEDLAKYPRTLENDMQLCKNLDVDIVFIPTSQIMYEEDEITLNPPKKMGYILEGYYRPTHFAGVLQIVLKLFNLIMPTRAYFGKKDAQQLLIIQKMVRHLCIPIQIIGMPIIRDFDALALSSRNVYLDSKQRQDAVLIPKAIFHIESRIIQDNERDTTVLKNEAMKILESLQIDYMDFYTHDLEITTRAEKCIFLLAVRVGSVRLLDNLWIQ